MMYVTCHISVHISYMLYNSISYDILYHVIFSDIQ